MFFFQTDGNLYQMILSHSLRRGPNELKQSAVAQLVELSGNQRYNAGGVTMLYP